jgi:cell division protein DivIC
MIADFSKKQNRASVKKRIISISLLVFFLIICGLFIKADIEVYHKKQELNLQVENFKKEIQKIKEENKKLEEGIANSENNDYIEKIAREELDMQKNGEKVISFVAPKNQQEQAKNQNSPTSYKNWFGWLSGIWQWLYGKK